MRRQKFRTGAKKQLWFLIYRIDYHWAGSVADLLRLLFLVTLRF